MRVFADSDHFIAWLNPNDANHACVRRYAREHQPHLVSTRWVLAEVADALAAPQWRATIGRFVRELEHQSGVVVHRDSDSLYAAGLALYEHRPDKHWSLTDCISFAAMERDGLREALTGDRHFEQAGFVPLFV